LHAGNDRWPLTTAFLHFLCTHCGESFYSQLPKTLTQNGSRKNSRYHALICAQFTRCFMWANCKNPRAGNFLSCTKNTELTRRDFARTFTFVSHKKSNPAEDGNRPETQRYRSACSPSGSDSLFDPWQFSESWEP